MLVWRVPVAAEPAMIGPFLALLALPASVATLAAPEREPIRLVSDFSLSPDGRRIAFAWAGDVWSADLEDGLARPVTRDPANDSSPRYSPDGGEIAFASNRDGGDQVYVVSASGGRPERITHHSERHSVVEWTPDGAGLLVRTARDHFWTSSSRLFVVPRGRRAPESLVFDAAVEDASLSPDGRRVLFSREGTGTHRKGYVGSQASQIWLYDRDADGYLQLLSDDLGYRSPRWKPDGRGFYFVGRQSGSFELWEADLDGGARRRLTHHGDDTVHSPAVSRDGRTIVYRLGFDLWILRPGSDEAPRRLALANAGEPVFDEWTRSTQKQADQAAFTDDGLEICFRSGGDLWVMDTELREPRRLTDAPGTEGEAAFTADGKAILFAGDLDGEVDVWRAERKNPDAYWWQNDEFVFTKLTDDAKVERDLQRGPDGRFAFVAGLGELVVMDEHGKGRTTIVSGWDSPRFDWSPDGKWIAYSRNDDDFNEDVWITPVDGSRPPFNVSVHPDNDSGPAWSPDGRVLAFTGRRADQEVDVYYVWLRASDAEEESRDRRLEKALEKMKKEREKGKKGGRSGSQKDGDGAKEDDAPPEKDGEKPDDDAESAEKKDDKDEPKKDEDEKPEVIVDFDGLRDRVHRISTPNSYDGGLVWLNDETLAFSSSAGPDGRATYTVKFPEELKPKKLTSSSLSGRDRLKKAKRIAGISSGSPAVMTDKGAITTYSFSVKQEFRTADRHAAAFVEGWRAMRDRFYDERLNGRDWDAIRRKYEPAARQAVDAEQLREVGNMMLGELNASHLGFSVFASSPRSSEPFTDVTAHLGVRFDGSFEGPGWRVRDVLPGGPASKRRSLIEAGEVVLSVDGTEVSPATDPTLVLNGDLDRDIQCQVRAADGTVRSVTIRPISYRTARSLLYDAWLERNRRAVDEASGGTLGYLHIRGMNWSSFLKFEEELYEVGYGKDGLVIDVRKNGGGSTTDHLLTALTQPVHAVTVPRGGGPGYPHDRKVYATWNKPIVVLCDQDSFSNAEIFSHAIKHLERGPIVGVPTAGGVISTGAQGLLDRFGMVRMPFRGWFLVDTGEDMELNGCVPHHVVWPWPGELPRGKDVQLETAVRVLASDVEAWKATPTPRLRKASERRD